jgi:uncharacterized membrane protein (UPF0127 family)
VIGVRGFGVVAILLFAASCGCSNGGAGTLHDGHVVEPPEVDAEVKPTVVVGSPATRVNVALARTPAERARGLMYVQNLPMDDGMLFLFEQEEDHEFWMKNTLIPLDMIFIRADLTVAGVVANAVPMTLDPRGVGKPSRYVLEVNGGWAAAHGVVADSRVDFQGFTP